MQPVQTKALFTIGDKEEVQKYIIFKVFLNREQVPAWLSTGKGLKISHTSLLISSYWTEASSYVFRKFENDLMERKRTLLFNDFSRCVTSGNVLWTAGPGPN